MIQTRRADSSRHTHAQTRLSVSGPSTRAASAASSRRRAARPDPRRVAGSAAHARLSDGPDANGDVEVGDRLAEGAALEVHGAARAVSPRWPRPMATLASSMASSQRLSFESAWHRRRKARLLDVGAPRRTCTACASPPRIRRGSGRWREEPAVRLVALGPFSAAASWTCGGSVTGRGRRRCGQRASLGGEKNGRIPEAETGDAPPGAARRSAPNELAMRFARRRDDPVGRRSVAAPPRWMLTPHPIDARGARSNGWGRQADGTRPTPARGACARRVSTRATARSRTHARACEYAREDTRRRGAARASASGADSDGPPEAPIAARRDGLFHPRIFASFMSADCTAASEVPAQPEFPRRRSRGASFRPSAGIPANDAACIPDHPSMSTARSVVHSTTPPAPFFLYMSLSVHCPVFTSSPAEYGELGQHFLEPHRRLSRSPPAARNSTGCGRPREQPMSLAPAAAFSMRSCRTFSAGSFLGSTARRGSSLLEARPAAAPWRPASPASSPPPPPCDAAILGGTPRPKDLAGRTSSNFSDTRPRASNRDGVRSRRIRPAGRRGRGRLLLAPPPPQPPPCSPACR